MGSGVIPTRRRTKMWKWGRAASNRCGRGRSARVGVDYLYIFCARVVERFGRLRLCGATVKFGNVGYNTVSFGFADGSMVV